jgi:DNA-directed RNA polymerase specialized sigma subunit
MGSDNNFRNLPSINNTKDNISIGDGQNTAEVDLARNLHVKDSDVLDALNNILTLLNTDSIKTDDDETQAILTDIYLLLSTGTITIDDSRLHSDLLNILTQISEKMKNVI